MPSKMYKPESLQKLPVRKLKEMCKEADKKVSGTKAELIKRLCGMEKEKTSGRIWKPKTMEEVNEWLEEQGVEDIEKVSKCLRAGILKGYIKVGVKNPLDKVIVSDTCYDCRTPIDVRIRDVLYQPDYPGGDCVSNSEEATIRCPGFEENPGYDCSGDVYLSAMCCKTPHIRNGKGHAHCDLCPGFGKCMGGYMLSHCDKCNNHFYGTRCDSCYYDINEHEYDSDDSDYDPPVHDCVIA